MQINFYYFAPLNVHVVWGSVIFGSLGFLVKHLLFSNFDFLYARL